MLPPDWLWIEKWPDALCADAIVCRDEVNQAEFRRLVTRTRNLQRCAPASACFLLTFQALDANAICG